MRPSNMPGHEEALQIGGDTIAGSFRFVRACPSTSHAFIVEKFVSFGVAYPKTVLMEPGDFPVCLCTIKELRFKRQPFIFWRLGANSPCPIVQSYVMVFQLSCLP